MQKVGIIGAMEQEVAQLKERMEGVTVKTLAGMDFCQGTLQGNEAVVVKSGIGKVNAAICTQILADMFEVGAVINTGIAGSLAAEINIGDIVLSTDLVHHDMDAVGFGYALGHIPGMQEFSFEADESLRLLALKACQEVNPDIRVFCGRIASGDQFISSQEKKDFIKSNFHALCTEMEGAAIAQTAHLNQIPFLVVRAISDKADGSAHMDYSVFEQKAIDHSVRLVERLMGSLA